MKLLVQYTAQLRAVLGRSEDEVELPEGSSLAELITHLASHQGDAAPHLLTDSNQARPSLLVVVNGSAVPVRAAKVTTLRAGDVVILLPPIAGG